jgi:hypothetical protein
MPRFRLDHPPTPQDVANEIEQKKLREYKKVWRNANNIVDIMGSSTLRAWGPLAEETQQEMMHIMKE